MFKNLVSNLPFSPALIGQVGFYARRLRREEATRRLGLVFTALAIVVQSFAVFAPPEAQAQASYNNVIYQGVNSKEEMVDVLRAGHDSKGRNDIRQIYEFFGITIADVQNAKETNFHSRDFNLDIWDVGRLPWDTGTEYSKEFQIPNTQTTMYARKLYRFDHNNQGTTYRALVGTRAIDGKWFGITIDCGNIVYVDFPTPPSPPPAPEPIPASTCAGLQVIAVSGSRNKFTLKGTATAEGGATISRYDFDVIDKDGKSVVNKQIASSDKSVATEVTVPRDGDFTAKVSVQTSAGVKTGADCAKPLKVTPEPRCPYNIDYTAANSECKPCPEDSSLWYKDAKCKAIFVPTKTVKNLSAGGGDANDTVVKPGDKLQYTLMVKNNGNNTGTMTMRENLADVMEYADVADLNGGQLEAATDKVSERYVEWPAATIKAGETTQRTVTVTVKSAIPATSQNVGNPESYNCVMTNSFGTTTNTKVECPAPKVVEAVVRTLPSTGTGENILFGGGLLMIVTYFYARSRLLGKEVRLVRKEFAAGTL